MDNGLEILRNIGAQTIHNETHISREYVQAIIHETFDGLKSVQFMGFISILEREYNIDLTDLKAKARAHFKDESEKEEANEKAFITQRTKASNAKIYIFLGVVIVASFIYMNSVVEKPEFLDNTKIEKVTKKLEKSLVTHDALVIKENNTTLSTAEVEIKKEILAEVKEVNTTVEPVVTEEEITPEVVIVKTLKILPKRKIWAGYINIKTNQKYQKVFRKEFALDTNKDWLLLFGAGTVKLEVNGENVKFSSKQNMRFKYINGVFTKISVVEFKALNKGRKW